SIANRLTGGTSSILFYGFSLTCLFAPGAFGSAHIVALVVEVPANLEYEGDFVLTVPSAFHSSNALRHLT
ncbi:hypothetical protein EDD16DRAFT_1489741, partial [Pisolithus croceorrhizus]